MSKQLIDRDEKEDLECLTDFIYDGPDILTTDLLSSLTPLL
jgi:hypothetical protein